MKTVYTTYAKAVDWCGNSIVLCNNVPEIDQSVWDNFEGNYLENEGTEDERYRDIYQWYITDCNQSDVEWLIKNFDLIFTYSEKLDCYILCVDHFGTGWSYVACEVKTKEMQERIKKDKLTYKDLTGYDR